MRLFNKQIALFILAFATVSCSSQKFQFKAVFKTCEPPASSARFGENPGPVITSPAPNDPFNTNVRVQGTCVDGYPLTVSGSGIPTAITTNCNNGVFSVDLVFTSGDGSKEIDVAQPTYVTGQSIMDRLCFTQDTVPPAVNITSGTGAQAVNTTTTTIQGTCEAGLDVIISGPNLNGSIQTSCNNGSFSAPVTFTGPDGLKDVVAVQVDRAGNNGQDNQQYLTDTVAPRVTIASPAPMTASSGVINISGTCENGFRVFFQGAVLNGVAFTDCINNSYTTPITLSSGDGVKNIVATQTDIAGNVGSANRDFVRDSTAPVIRITGPAANTITRGAIALTGTCETGLTVNLSGSGLSGAQTGSCSNGTFSSNINLAGNDGIKDIIASQTDAVGNSASDTRSFIKDTTAPVLTITSPAANSTWVSGIQLQGTCEAGLTVNISGSGANTSATTNCNSSGQFDTFVTFSPVDGNKQINVSQTDAAGNTGNASRTFIRDSNAPVLAITSPGNNSFVSSSATIRGNCESGFNVILNGSGLSSTVTTPCTNSSFSNSVTFTAGDGNKVVVATQTDGAGNTSTDTKTYIKDTVAPAITITGPSANSYHQNTLTLVGTCEAGLAVNLSGTGLQGPSNTPCSSGSFSVVINLTSGDGIKNIIAGQTDAAGNSASDNRDFIRDTTAPVLTITSPSANSIWQNTLTLVGTCENGLTVNLSGAGLQSPSTTTCSSGSFSVVVTLTPVDGVKNIIVSQTDTAGNSGSANRDFIRDNAGPAIQITGPAANSVWQNGLTLVGNCEPGLTVNLSGAGLQSPNTTTCPSGTFSVPITFSAGDGSKNIIVSQTDGAGNSASDTRSFLRDTTAPLIAIVSPAANSLSAGSLTLQGTCEAGLTVNLGGAGLQGPSITTCSGGNFSVAINLTAVDGAKNITVSQTDAAGNTGSDSRVFIRDSSAPLLAITNPPSNSTWGNGLTLVGTCENGFVVNLSGAGLQSPSTTTCASGSFSVAITFTAGDGSKNIIVSQTDGVGNTSTDNRTFIKDTTAPVIRITSPAANSTWSAGLTLAGTCETGLTVNLSGAGLQSPATTTCSGGNFSVAITFTSGDGAKNIIVSQTDSVGNSGSDNRSFMRDSTAPVIAITSPAANTIAQSGVTLQGTCEIGLTVNLSGTGLQSPSTTTCPSGTFSVPVTFTAGDGNKNIIASQTDSLGNSGSDNRTFIRDAAAPILAITSPAAGTTAQTGVTLQGTCEAGLTVNLSGAGLQSPSTTTCSGGNFSVGITFTAGDGAKNIIVSQTDGAGNTGSANRTFNRDSTAPILAITSPAAGTTAQTGVTLQGTCEAGLTVNLSGAGLQSPSSTTCSGGNFSVGITFTAGDGAKNIIASQTDGAGNSASDNRTFNRDSTPPAIRITSPAANSLWQNNLTLQGTCETGLTVNLSGAGLQSPSSTTCSGGNFSVSITLTAGDGNKNIIASQTDAAGNSASDNRTFVRDSSAPLLAITGPAANSTWSAGLTLVGTCEAGLTVNLSGAGLQSPSTTTCPSGSFSVPITFTAGDGAKNIIVSQTDGVGNTSTDNRTFNRDSTAPIITITSPAANSVWANGITIQGTCETGLNVVLSGTGISSSTSTTCNAGTFSASITFSAGDGPKNIIASQTDSAANTGSANRTFIKDTTAPVIAITAPATGTIAQSGVTLQGTCEIGLTVNLSGAGLQSPSTTTCPSGNFSVPVTFTTGDGIKNIIVSQTDSVGNTGSDNRNFARDTTAPAIAITSPASGTIAQNGVTLQGTCEIGLTVNLSGAGLQSPSTTTCASGNFSVPVVFTAGDGAKNIIVSQTDTVGNTGSDNRSFIKDATAPAIQITSPAANSQHPSIITIDGICESGLTVNISGDISAPSTTACNSGQFSANLTFSSGIGVKNITVSQTDQAGNTGIDTRPFTNSNNSGVEVFTSNGPGGMVDILFVDDNSASMDAEQIALGSKFSSFTAAMTGVDWQVGITTTDCTAGSPYNICGSLLPMSGLGSQYILTASTPNYLTAFQNTIQRPETINCLLAGNCPSGREEGLKATMTAMNKRNVENAGFFRTGADLAVVILSDEDEWSNAGTVPNANATTAQQVINNFRSIWGTSKKFSNYSIIIKPGDAACLNTQRQQLGNNAFYGVYADQLSTLTGGMSVSICEPDYSITLDQIGQNVTMLSRSIDLAQTPIPGTVNVVFTPAYSTTWTVTGNRITFAVPAPAGTQVQISYQY